MLPDGEGAEAAEFFLGLLLQLHVGQHGQRNNLWCHHNSVLLVLSCHLAHGC